MEDKNREEAHKEDNREKSEEGTTVAYTKKLLELRKSFASTLTHFSDVSTTLDSTSSNLNKSADVYTSYNTNIKKSRGLNNDLIKQHRRNVIMVYGSYWFLIIVCIWVSGKRLGIWRLLLAFMKGLLWSLGKMVGLV